MSPAVALLEEEVYETGPMFAKGISRLVGFMWCKGARSCAVTGVARRSGGLGMIVVDWMA